MYIDNQFLKKHYLKELMTFTEKNMEYLKTKSSNTNFNTCNITNISTLVTLNISYYYLTFLVDFKHLIIRSVQLPVELHCNDYITIHVSHVHLSSSHYNRKS